MARVTGFVGQYYSIDEEVPDGATFEEIEALLEERYAEGSLPMDVLEDHDITDLVVRPSAVAG